MSTHGRRPPLGAKNRGIPFGKASSRSLDSDNSDDEEIAVQFRANAAIIKDVSPLIHARPMKSSPRTATSTPKKTPIDAQEKGAAHCLKNSEKALPQRKVNTHEKPPSQPLPRDGGEEEEEDTKRKSLLDDDDEDPVVTHFWNACDQIGTKVMTGTIEINSVVSPVENNPVLARRPFPRPASVHVAAHHVKAPRHILGKRNEARRLGIKSLQNRIAMATATPREAKMKTKSKVDLDDLPGKLPPVEAVAKGLLEDDDSFEDRKPAAVPSDFLKAKTGEGLDGRGDAASGSSWLERKTAKASAVPPKEKMHTVEKLLKEVSPTDYKTLAQDSSLVASANPKDSLLDCNNNDEEKEDLAQIKLPQNNGNGVDLNGEMNHSAKPPRQSSQLEPFDEADDHGSPPIPKKSLLEDDEDDALVSHFRDACREQVGTHVLRGTNNGTDEPTPIRNAIKASKPLSRPAGIQAGTHVGKTAKKMQGKRDGSRGLGVKSLQQRIATATTTRTEPKLFVKPKIYPDDVAGKPAAGEPAQEDLLDDDASFEDRKPAATSVEPAGTKGQGVDFQLPLRDNSQNRPPWKTQDDKIDDSDEIRRFTSGCEGIKAEHHEENGLLQDDGKACDSLAEGNRGRKTTKDLSAPIHATPAVAFLPGASSRPKKSLVDDDEEDSVQFQFKADHQNIVAAKSTSGALKPPAQSPRPGSTAAADREEKEDNEDPTTQRKSLLEDEDEDAVVSYFWNACDQVGTKQMDVINDGGEKPRPSEKVTIASKLFPRPTSIRAATFRPKSHGRLLGKRSEARRLGVKSLQNQIALATAKPIVTNARTGPVANRIDPPGKLPSLKSTQGVPLNDDKSEDGKLGAGSNVLATKMGNSDVRAGDFGGNSLTPSSLNRKSGNREDKSGKERIKADPQVDSGPSAYDSDHDNGENIPFPIDEEAFEIFGDQFGEFDEEVVRSVPMHFDFDLEKLSQEEDFVAALPCFPEAKEGQWGDDQLAKQKNFQTFDPNWDGGKVSDVVNPNFCRQRSDDSFASVVTTIRKFRRSMTKVHNRGMDYKESHLRPVVIPVMSIPPLPKELAFDMVQTSRNCLERHRRGTTVHANAACTLVRIEPEKSSPEKCASGPTTSETSVICCEGCNQVLTVPKYAVMVACKGCKSVSVASPPSC